jgi:hypothetical protein
MRMSAGLPELLLLSLTASGTCIAALFAMLCFLRIRQPANTLSPEGASQLLRAETDMVRTAVQDQALWLRQELGQSFTGFQRPVWQRDHREGVIHIFPGTPYACLDWQSKHANPTRLQG